MRQREKVGRKAEEHMRALTEKVDTGDYQDRESLEQDVARVRETLQNTAGLVSGQDALDKQLNRLYTIYEAKQQRVRETQNQQKMQSIEERLVKIQEDMGDEAGKQVVQA